mgnify:FL=1
MRSTAALCHHPHMTSHNPSHSVPMLRLVVAPHAESLPGDRLLANVSAEALLRAASFLSPKRRLEFLWSRVMLAKLLENEPQAAVVEIPPRSPRIEGADVSETSISHTKTWIGAVVSSVPVGIDMEVMQPSRVNEAIFTRLFDKRHWDAAENRVADFYCFFGMYESAVKMNVPFCSACDHPYVGHCAQSAASVRFFSDGQTLLTVVTAEPVQLEICQYEVGPDAQELIATDALAFIPVEGPACLRRV